MVMPDFQKKKISKIAMPPGFSTQIGLIVKYWRFKLFKRLLL